jgi:hypothetical protein
MINKTLFLQLLLAHLLADFSFQSKWVYELKFKYRWGVAVHGSIFGILAFVFLSPYFTQPEAILAAFFLWISHILIDKGKTEFTLRKKIDNLWLFLLDQLAHHLLVLLISFLGQKWTCSTLPPFLRNIYFNYPLLVIIGCYLVITSPGTIFIFQCKKTFCQKWLSEEVKQPQGTLRYLEMIYRLLAMYLMKVYFPLGVFIVLVTVIFLIFLYLKKTKLDLVLNLVFSTFIALGMGFFLRALIEGESF